MIDRIPYIQSHYYSAYFWEAMSTKYLEGIFIEEEAGFYRHMKKPCGTFGGVAHGGAWLCLVWGS